MVIGFLLVYKKIVKNVLGLGCKNKERKKGLYLVPEKI
jgi:hypothetical protein